MDWNSLEKTDDELLGVWTGTGQNVYLEISAQVMIVRERIPEIYYRFGEHYRDHLR